ncbi:MAG: hypothetical protein RXP97_03315 [Nitrososphaeria archaeon]|jgi:hypothetical protein
MQSTDYVMGVKRSCTSESYLAMVKWEKRDEVLEILKRKLSNFEGFEDLFYSGDFGGRRIVYYYKSGRLLLELPEGDDVQGVISDLLS